MALKNTLSKILDLFRVKLPPPKKVDPKKIPLGPGDELYPESHRFGPSRWWN